MKKTRIILFAFLIGMMGLGTFTSCKKYDEGPAFSLRSKKERVANSWKVVKATDLTDGSDVTSDYAGDVFEFTKDGDFFVNGTKEGTWEFSSDKEQIIITLSAGGTDVYIIKKLKEKEMWLEDSGQEEIRFEPA